VIALLFAACVGTTPEEPPPPPPESVRTGPWEVVPGPDLVGLCDASAAAMVGRFLVVADDTQNVLWVFDWEADATPAGRVDLGALHPDFAGDTADIEGLTVAPDGRMWIVGSHDAGEGTERLAARQRIAALYVLANGTLFTATLAAGPWTKLLEERQPDTPLSGIVANSAGRASSDPMGLSIEGIAAGADGGLVFGFRTPIHAGKALLEQVNDPNVLMAGGDVVWTGPKWLGLADRGVRSIERDGDGFLVIVGPADMGAPFALARTGAMLDATPAEILPVAFGDLTPEGLFTAGGEWFVVSDDGDRCDPAAPKARTARIPVQAFEAP